MDTHPQPGDTITKWGYTFTWTKHHLPRSHTEPLRQQYDELGAAALEKLQVIRASLLADSQAHGTNPPSNDLYTLLKEHHHTDETLTAFWNDTHVVPEWVDWEQLARAQKIFYRYAIANIVGFALQGFVAENSVCLRLLFDVVPCMHQVYTLYPPLHILYPPYLYIPTLNHILYTYTLPYTTPY